MENTLNTNQEARDEILEPFYLDKCTTGHNCASYAGLTLAALEELVARNFIDLEEQQNDAPTVREILEFMRKHPTFTAHGYAIDKSRDDYRVSIEGVMATDFSVEKDLFAFIELFRFADEFDVSPEQLYCWFD